MRTIEIRIQFITDATDDQVHDLAAMAAVQVEDPHDWDGVKMDATTRMLFTEWNAR